MRPRLLARAATSLVDRALARVASPLPGVSRFAPEWNFLNAYRMHASALGRPAGLLPDDQEFDGERWGAAFQDFVARFPAVVDTWV